MARPKEFFAKNKRRQQYEGKFHELHPEAGKFLLKKLISFSDMQKLLHRSKDPETRRSEILMDLYREKEKEILQGKPEEKSPTGPTLGDAVDQYLTRREKSGITYDTWKVYRLALGNLQDCLGTHKRLLHIDNADAEAFECYLLEKLSPQSARTRVTHVKTFLFWAQRIYGLDIPHFEKIVVPRQEPDPYEIEEWKLLVQHCRNNNKKNLERLFMMMGLTGMRVREVWKISLSEMKSYVRVDTKGQQLGVKKVMGEALQEFCGKDLAERSKKERFWLDKGDGRKAWASVQSIVKAVKDVCAELGINRRMPTHSIRSMVITELLADNVSLGVVQGIAGHSQPSTTMRYTKPGRLRNQYQSAMDNLSNKMSI